jgi:hypothetical protein
MYAKGRLIYDAGGRVAVQMARPGPAPFVSGDPCLPTDAEARAAYNRYLAYYGTHEVAADGETVVHHLEASLIPDWEAGDQVRHFNVEGNRLTLTTPSMQLGGIEQVTTLLWEKVA